MNLQVSIPLSGFHYGPSGTIHHKRKYYIEEVGVKTDRDLNQSWLKYITFQVFINTYNHMGASQIWLVVKNSLASPGDAREVDLIPGLGRSLEGGHSNPLQYSCLENHRDRGAWEATGKSIGLQRVRND